MADPVEIINQIISNAINQANEYTASADTAAQRLISNSIGVYIEPPSNLTGFVPSAVEPDIPPVTDSIVQYDAQLEKVIDLLSGQLAGFFRTYYPLESDAFDEATNWLVNQITNGGTGINPTIETALWQRARDRIGADTRKTEQQISTGYAAKGYSLPPGAMLGKIDEVRIAGLRAIGESSSGIAIEQFKTEVEMVKFAVEMAINSRKMAMDAAADYIRAIASAPDSAVRTMNMKDENMARMMSAAATWYNARLNRDEIVLKGKLAELATGQQIYQHRGSLSVQADGVRTQALGHAADVYARTAAAALSSLNSIVSTAANN